MKKAREGMTDDEAQFSVEVPLEKKNMLWSDKYRPRKPRFFNRVHTVSENIISTSVFIPVTNLILFTHFVI